MRATNLILILSFVPPSPPSRKHNLPLPAQLSLDPATLATVTSSPGEITDMAFACNGSAPWPAHDERYLSVRKCPLSPIGVVNQHEWGAPCQAARGVWTMWPNVQQVVAADGMPSDHEHNIRRQDREPAIYQKTRIVPCNQTTFANHQAGIQTEQLIVRWPSLASDVPIECQISPTMACDSVGLVGLHSRHGNPSAILSCWHTTSTDLLTSNPCSTGIGHSPTWVAG